MKWPFKRNKASSRYEVVYTFEPKDISTEDLALIVADIINNGFVGGIPGYAFKLPERFREHFRPHVVESLPLPSIAGGGMLYTSDL